MKEKTVAIVLAGGTGIRMKRAHPKQFILLSGKPLIIHTLNQFQNNTLISDIVVVCHKKYIAKLKSLIKRYRIKKACRVISGGRTRQESSFIGLNNCPPRTKVVLIHDAVRPFVDSKIIKRTFDAAKKAGAAITAIEVTDTIIKTKKDFVKDIPDRKSLRSVQTPQGFRYNLICKAHELALKKGIKNATDDASLILAMGKPVKLVEGSESNIKITTKADFYIAENIVRGERWAK